MRRCIVTMGPRFSGKTTFCQKAVCETPGCVLVSADLILKEKFGGHVTDWVSKAVANALTIQELVTKLSKPDSIVITDFGPWVPDKLQTFITRLRTLGVRRVEGWWFVTSKQTSLEWFLGEFHDVVTDENFDAIEAKMAQYLNQYDEVMEYRSELPREFDLVHDVDPLVTSVFVLLAPPNGQWV